MPVALANEQQGRRLDGRRIKRDAQRLLEALDLADQQLSILLTDDRRMALLHERWMGEPGPTDVLSFSVDEGGWGAGDAGGRTRRRARRPKAEDGRREHPKASGPVPPCSSPPLILGDIAISAETAARRRPRAVLAEVRRYLVHGVLHLAGYDHRQIRPRRRMQRQERRLRLILEGRE